MPPTESAFEQVQTDLVRDQDPAPGVDGLSVAELGERAARCVGDGANVSDLFSLGGVGGWVPHPQGEGGVSRPGRGTIAAAM